MASVVRVLFASFLVSGCFCAASGFNTDGSTAGHHQEVAMKTGKEPRQPSSAVVVVGEGGSNNGKEPLTCHQCHSIPDGPKCIHLAPNSTSYSKPCLHTNQTSCMVKRFSYTENATAPSSIWSIERNCSAKCEPGCLILGERTKLYVCTSCCNQSGCNIGNWALRPFITLSHSLLLFLFVYLFK